MHSDGTLIYIWDAGMEISIINFLRFEVQYPSQQASLKGTVLP